MMVSHRLVYGVIMVHDTFSNGMFLVLICDQLLPLDELVPVYCVTVFSIAKMYQKDMLRLEIRVE